jgi:hypothetical protein
VIRCGWCGKPTANEDRCTSCGHSDPTRPYFQRGEAVPQIDGRLDSADVRRRLAEARSALGGNPSVERIAEHLDVSPRTVRRWRELAAS